VLVPNTTVPPSGALSTLALGEPISKVKNGVTYEAIVSGAGARYLLVTSAP